MTTLHTTFTTQDDVEVLVDSFTNNSKISSSDINSTNNSITFSDDDSSCSFDSEEDEKLLTPPIQLSDKNPITEEEQVINTIEECKEENDNVDWGKVVLDIMKFKFLLISFLIEFWSNVISSYNNFSQSQVKDLSIQVQRGIPSALRGTIWPLLSKKKEDGLQDHYIQLLRQESVYEKAITRDLHRTFPHHPYFQSSIGQESLFNVVKVSSFHIINCLFNFMHLSKF